MEHRAFGPTGRQVALFGQGTWHMELDVREEAIRAIRLGLDLGMTHVDTAELYGAGEVETLVGEAIAGRRDEVFLASKVLPGNASYDGTLRACEQSLARLGTDRLDLYLLHWPGAQPLGRTIEAFEKLSADGKILAWGVSNFDVEHLEEALALCGPGRIACNQVLYHLGERGIEHRVLPWCEANDVAVVAYSPFGSGHFPAPHSPGGQTLQRIADAHGASPRQVALRFLTRRASTFAIPKAASPSHVASNADADRLRLSEEEIARIDEAFALGAPPRELPVL